MRILGVTASGFFGGGDFELISTSILPSAQSSVVFDVSTFASTYKHLQIRAAVKTNAGGWPDDLQIRFNNDSGSNYNGHAVFGSQIGAVESISSGSTTSIPTILTSGGGPGDLFSANIIDILDAYSAIKNTTVRAMSGVISAGSQIRFTSGLWRNTASLTSITLNTGSTTNFIAGSRFSLYGIKG
jgi:hypothetical protein